jgi:hypothetical protein
MNDLMIDIETLGTQVNSVITQIGAVYFDRNSAELGKEISLNIQVQDCLNHGLQIDGGALRFWFEQTKCYESRELPSWFKEPIPLSLALENLRRFYDKEALVWAHATFDFPIIANAYQVLGQGFCFPYRKLRDIRTLTDLAGVKKDTKKHEDQKSHDALEDCKYQVQYCCECFKILKKSN